VERLITDFTQIYLQRGKIYIRRSCFAVLATDGFMLDDRHCRRSLQRRK